MTSESTESRMAIIYVVCDNLSEAKNISKKLLTKKLCACTNILPNMTSFYFWPPIEKTMVEGNEVVLLIKTLEEKYEEVESEVLKLHSYSNPCIFAVNINKVSAKYLKWVRSEIK